MFLELDSSYVGNLEPYDPIHRTQSMLRSVSDKHEFHGSFHNDRKLVVLDIRHLVVGCRLGGRDVEVSSCGQTV